MNLSTLALRRPVPVILFFLIVTLAGIRAFRQMPVTDEPTVEEPTILIVVDQPGVSPGEMATAVTKKIEDAATSLKSLAFVRAFTWTGKALVRLNLVSGTDVDKALQETKDLMSRLRPQLPPDIDEPDIHSVRNGDTPIITYAVTSTRLDLAALSRFVDDEIVPELRSAPGIGDVQRIGGVEREVQVTLEPDRLQALGLSVSEVSKQLKAVNVNRSGGRTTDGETERSVRILGGATTTEGLAATPVRLAAGASVPLGALGEVSDGMAPTWQSAWYDGQPSVGLAVIRAPGAALLDTTRQLESLTAEFQLPEGMSMVPAGSLAPYTEATYQASVDALLLGTALAVVIVYLFLRDWRATLISGLAIPLSVLGTLWFLQLTGEMLHTLNLLGLILVVGILVDDAIVDVENIVRHLARGTPPLQATQEATDEIGTAVIATTLTIVGALAPILFLNSVVGDYFHSFASTISVAVILSLLIARTLTPLLAAHLLRPAAGAAHEPPPIPAVLAASLRRPGRVIGLTAAVIGGSLFLLPEVPRGFLDSGDTSQTTLAIELPSGTDRRTTEAVAAQAQQRLRRLPEVRHVFADVGGAGPRDTHQASLQVQLVGPEARQAGLRDFEGAAQRDLQAIPGATFTFLQGTSGTDKPIHLILSAGTAEGLATLADRVYREMVQVPGIVDVTSTAAQLVPEVIIRPDTVRAAALGVTSAAIAETARLATAGDIDVALPKTVMDGKQTNVRLRLPEWFRHDWAHLGQLAVPGDSGLVPLKAVATWETGRSPAVLKSFNRRPQATLSANVTGITLGQAMAKLRAMQALTDLPADAQSRLLGDAGVLDDVFDAAWEVFPTSVIVIYVILCLLFGDFVHPVTIMLAMPLSLIGALLGLLLTGKSLDLPALTGILMLLGLTTKNSILLVDHAIRCMKSGLSCEEALLQSVSERLRPILMTSAAMVSGMLPIAFSLGAGSGPRSSLAVAVIGGLITSTVLTLAVVPAAFLLQQRLRARLAAWWRRSRASGAQAGG
jgi:HAE1 family hydrophobic/amphiphilic exporter-1